jgi:dGTPase
MSDKLATYAVCPQNSRSRRFHEKPHPYRSPFERDRDRIIHCSAFRRLEGKTQVFMPGVNDQYRTRLTHSIEVAQIGRTIAANLNLNVTLTEAICLGHDLGHSPFGHTGERILNTVMADNGGFEHNLQTLRIVDYIEHPYPDFPGLNLVYETRLGFARHHSPYDSPPHDAFDELNCTLEGQIADIADRIAYNCHDLEDGTQSRLIDEEQTLAIELVASARDAANADAIDDYVIRRTRTSKAILDFLVSDCIESSKNKIASAHINSPQQVCNTPDKFVVLGADAQRKLEQLEQFLMQNLYQNPLLLSAGADIGRWINSAFEKLCKNPALMPAYFRRMIDNNGLQRTVCDYVAGMTDRFCLSLLDEI